MSKTTLDLSTLSDISDGTHTVKVKAKADGYRDSEFSNEVSYTKAPQYVLNGKYEFNYEPTIDPNADVKYYYTFNIYGSGDYSKEKYGMRVRGYITVGQSTGSIDYYNNNAHDNISTAYSRGAWTSSYYWRRVQFNNLAVDADFYNFITSNTTPIT